jgi:hypothetical protein
MVALLMWGHPGELRVTQFGRLDDDSLVIYLNSSQAEPVRKLGKSWAYIVAIANDSSPWKN